MNHFPSILHCNEHPPISLSVTQSAWQVWSQQHSHHRYFSTFNTESWCLSERVPAWPVIPATLTSQVFSRRVDQSAWPDSPSPWVRPAATWCHESAGKARHRPENESISSRDAFGAPRIPQEIMFFSSLQNDRREFYKDPCIPIAWHQATSGTIINHLLRHSIHITGVDFFFYIVLFQIHSRSKKSEIKRKKSVSVT